MRNRSRFVYLLVFALGCLAVFLLDRIEPRNFCETRMQAVRWTAGLLRIEAERFFDERVGFVKGEAAMLASVPKEEWQKRAGAMADHLGPRRLEGLVLMLGKDRDLYMRGLENGFDPEDGDFLRAQGERLARQAFDQRRCAVAAARTRNGRAAGVLVLAPILRGAEVEGALGGFFSLSPLTAPPRRAGASRKLLLRWVAPDGKVAAQTGDEPVMDEVTEKIAVADGVWLVRVGCKPEAGYHLLVSRSLIWVLGLILVLSLLTFCFLMEHRTAALQQANQVLRAQTEEVRVVNRRLLTANRDLAEFTHAVSHDLKEPLRGVEALSKLLLADCVDKLDEACREKLSAIHDCSTRMKGQLEALQQVSRLSSQRYPTQEVDFGELLEEVKVSLAFAIEKRGAEVSARTPLPALRCDRVRMMRLLSNLIGNAIKFCDQETPVVTLGCRETDEEYIFGVRDNGIGIGAEDLERIFQIFTRLHPQERYPGTGVGLALCQRIVEKHGGRIWAESVVGVGSVFYFTIPKGSEAGACARGEAIREANSGGSDG